MNKLKRYGVFELLAILAVFAAVLFLGPMLFGR
jgi:hypothetical protein